MDAKRMSARIFKMLETQGKTLKVLVEHLAQLSAEMAEMSTKLDTLAAAVEPEPIEPKPSKTAKKK